VPRHDHYRDIDTVEGGGRGADHRVLRSGKAEHAVRARSVRVLRRYFDWGLSILMTEFETSRGAVDLRGWRETAKDKQQALYGNCIRDNHT
jgi:hypothetical protein